MNKPNLQLLADASLGVFKPLKLDVEAQELKKQLQEERALRVAAVRALADDSTEHEARLGRIAELEEEVNTLRTKVTQDDAELARIRTESEDRRLALSSAAELHLSLKEQHDQESRARAHAEVLHGSASRSLEEAMAALATSRQAHLESEARCTALTAAMRRPVNAPEAPAYDIEMVRAGPGGELHKLRLVPVKPTAQGQ